MPLSLSPKNRRVGLSGNAMRDRGAPGVLIAQWEANDTMTWLEILLVVALVLIALGLAR
jgi:hypothetical protein